MTRLFTAFKPLHAYDMEELAARQRSLIPRGGVLFARNVDGEAKSAARDLVLNLFAPDRWPDHLHMLTMPGLQWRFERKLLGMREVGWMAQQKPHPKRTFFTAAENDRAIYYSAVTQMPGLHTPLRAISKFPFAERAVKTHYASFFFANIDDMLAYDWQGHKGRPHNNRNQWDAVWLDYTGPMTVERLALVAEFYRRYVRSILVVTVLKARWNDQTVAAIKRAGGHAEWLREHLPGEVLHDVEYHDTSPMAQIAVRKEWTCPLV